MRTRYFSLSILLAPLVGCAAAQPPESVRAHVKQKDLVEIAIPGSPQFGDAVTTDEFYIQAPGYAYQPEGFEAHVLEEGRWRTVWNCERSPSEEGQDEFSCRSNDVTVTVGRHRSQRDEAYVNVRRDSGLEVWAFLETDVETDAVLGLRPSAKDEALAFLIRDGEGSRVYAPAGDENRRLRAATVLALLGLNEHGWDLPTRNEPAPAPAQAPAPAPAP